MAADITHMRELLLPGLYDVRDSWSALPAQWDSVFVINAPDHLAFKAVSSVSFPVAVALGVATVVIKNPIVSRRLWAS